MLWRKLTLNQFDDEVGSNLSKWPEPYDLSDHAYVSMSKEYYVFPSAFGDQWVARTAAQMSTDWTKLGNFDMPEEAMRCCSDHFVQQKAQC